MRALFSAALLLAACDASTKSNDPSQVSVREMLQSGDTRVCVNPDVQLQLVDLLRKAAGANVFTMISDDDFKKFVESGQKVEFQAVSATGVNKDISEISCSGNVQGDLGDSNVDWKVRPQLDNDNGFIVELPEQRDNGAPLAVVMAIRNALKAKSSEQPEPTQRGEELTNDVRTDGSADASTDDYANMQMNADEYPEMNATTNTVDQ